MKKESLALTEGALVDDLLFLSKEDFNKKYILGTVKLPTASTKVLADEAVRECVENNRKYQDLDYVQLINRLSIWTTIKKEDTLKKRYNYDDFYKYIDLMVQTKQRNLTLITPEMYSKAKEQVKILLDDDNVNHNFIKSDHIENIYQYKLEFEYDGIKFLGYYDILQINHKEKTIQVKDLKTTSLSANKFYKQFISLNYYIQGGLYSLGLAKVVKDLKLDGYKVLPMEFIYTSFVTKDTITYVFPNRWFTASLNGFYRGGVKYRGIIQLIEDIKWHFDNEVFDRSRFLYENKNKIELDTNSIKVIEDETK